LFLPRNAAFGLWLSLFLGLSFQEEHTCTIEVSADTLRFLDASMIMRLAFLLDSPYFQGSTYILRTTVIGFIPPSDRDLLSPVLTTGRWSLQLPEKRNLFLALQQLASPLLALAAAHAKEQLRISASGLLDSVNWSSNIDLSLVSTLVLCF